MKSVICTCTIFLLVERACIFFLLQSKRGAQYICVSTYIVNTVHTIFVHIDVFLYFVHTYSFSYIFFYSILNLLAFSHFFFHQHSVTLTVCCIDLVLISSPDWYALSNGIMLWSLFFFEQIVLCFMYCN